MAGLTSGLVAASPAGPAEPVGCVVDGSDDDSDEQALDFVAGERDEGVGCGVAGVFIGADGCEEGVGKHGEGDPAGPGRVATDLVLTQSGQTLAGLERLSTRHLDPATRTSMTSDTGTGESAAVAGEFSGGAVAADQQLAAACGGGRQVDGGPVVEAVPLRPRSCGQLLPGSRGHLLDQVSARNVPALVVTSRGQATAGT